MVNLPGNPTGSAPSSAPTGDIQLNATSSDSLRYLSQHVGELLEARVTRVSQLAAAAANASTNAPLASSTSSSATLPANAVSANGQPAKDFEVVLNIGKQQIIVKSPLAPRLGQILQLQVLSSQQLRITEISGQNPAAAADAKTTVGTERVASQVASNVSLSQTAIAKTIVDPAATLLNTLTNNQLSNANGNNSQQQALLQSALRDTLPRQISRDNLLSTLQTIAVGQTSSATKSLNVTGANNINVAVNNFINSINPLNTLVQVNGLKQALQNSGVFYESKLASLALASAVNNTASISQNKPATNSYLNNVINNNLALAQNLSLGQNDRAASLNSTINNALNLNATVKQAVANLLGLNSNSPAPASTQLTNSSTTSAGSIPSLDTLAANTASATLSGRSSDNLDHKLALLGVIQSIKSHLAGGARADIAGVDAKINPLLADNAVLSALWHLQANRNLPSRSPGANADKDDGLVQLLRMALGALSRTQSHQLMSVNSQLAANADPANNQTLTMELPVWIDQKLNIIDLRVDSEKQSASQSAAEEKVWNARLQFDLEQHGNLLAFATLRGKTLAAVLWASDPVTTDKINKELSQVADNLLRFGLQVQNLQCRTGEPDELPANGTINLLDTEI